MGKVSHTHQLMVNWLFLKHEDLISVILSNVTVSIVHFKCLILSLKFSQLLASGTMGKYLPDFFYWVVHGSFLLKFCVVFSWCFLIPATELD